MTAMTDQVWAVATGEYEDYGIIALFESRDDAQALVDQLDATQGVRGGYYVEEFPFYRTGDRSLRPVSVWVHWVDVHTDGSIHDSAKSPAYPRHGLSSDPPYTPWVRKEERRRGVCYVVSGSGETREQAREDARDRAAQVAALMAEGVDPLKVQPHARASDD